jgi:hypothetical protein
MMLRKMAAATLVLFMAPISAADAGEKEAGAKSFEAEVYELRSQELSTRSKADAYRRLYSKYYSEQKTILNIGKPDQSRKWFDAIRSVYFYTLDRKYLPELSKSLKQLEANRSAHALDYESYYKSLLASREFESARAFLKIHPNVASQPLPKIVRLEQEGWQLTEWLIEENGKALRQTVYEMPMGPVIIAISNPGCHFSRNAINAIKQDKQLAEKILPLIKLVAPPDFNFNVEEIQRWNGVNSKLKMTLMHDINDWPMVTDWSTPSFYFFRNRKLVAQVFGWPKSGNKEAMFEGLKKIGVD